MGNIDEKDIKILKMQIEVLESRIINLEALSEKLRNKGCELSKDVQRHNLFIKWASGVIPFILALSALYPVLSRAFSK